MEYDIVVVNDPFKMAQHVNEKCADGWEPCGSAFVAATDSESWYYSQAIIRKTPKTAEGSQNSTQQTVCKMPDSCEDCQIDTCGAFRYGNDMCHAKLFRHFANL